MRLLGLGLVMFLQPEVQAQEEINQLKLLRQLQQKVEELELKVKELESKGSAVPARAQTAPDGAGAMAQSTNVQNTARMTETAKADGKDSPKISIGSKGFSFGSANGDFAVQLKGVLQVDSRTFFEDSGITGNDGILLRRARPILQGTVFRDFDFNFTPDFAGTGSPQIFDAYLNYRYSPALQFRAGKFKTPVGLEQLQADVNTHFNERSLATDLVPNRDLGFQLHGDLWGGLFSYAAGIFNGVGDYRNSGNADIEDNKEFAGRLFVQPFKLADAPALEGLGLGVAGSYEALQRRSSAGLPATTGGTLAGYTTVGQQQFFAYNPAGAAVLADGEHWRLSPQGYYYYGPYSLLGEYVISDQQVTRTVTAPLISRRLQHKAWQVTAGWVLTGEDASFGGGIVPRKPFDPVNGGWGALQLVGRFSELDIDPDAFPLFSDPRSSAHSAQEWSIGLNWYLNRNVRVNTSFSRTVFGGAGGAGASAPAAVTRRPEEVLFTRVQLGF